MSERLTLTDLRRLAAGMPYRKEASRAEVLAWLAQYRPDVLARPARPLDETKEPPVSEQVDQ